MAYADTRCRRMRQVQFRSSKFPSYGTEEEGANFEAGLWGKWLAEYLQAKLPAKGFPVKFAVAEDWG